MDPRIKDAIKEARVADIRCRTAMNSIREACQHPHVIMMANDPLNPQDTNQIRLCEVCGYQLSSDWTRDYWRPSNDLSPKEGREFRMVDVSEFNTIAWRFEV